MDGPAKRAWFNRTRVRRQAILLAVLLWLGYAVNVATPGLRDRFGHLKGADFLHGYTLGSLALQHRGAALYDANAQAAESAQRVPESRGDYFLPVYGPQYSLLFIPLAWLPYGPAAVLWMALSAVLYGACCYAIWRQCPHLATEGRMVLLLAVAFPGFFNLIVNGQNSALALACFTAAYLALRSRRSFAAGLCIGVLFYKPQLGMAAAAVFVGCGGWKVVAGAMTTAVAQLAIGVAYYGGNVLSDYAHVLRQISSSASLLEPKPYLMHSLRALFLIPLPWSGAAFVLYVLAAGAATGMAIMCWRSRAELELRYSALLIATVLIAPHLTVYDLVILAPALLLLGDWLIANPEHPQRPRLQWFLYLAYILPLFGPLARFTHLQVSVIAFAGLLFGVVAITRERHGGSTSAEAEQVRVISSNSLSASDRSSTPARAVPE